MSHINRLVELEIGLLDASWIEIRIEIVDMEELVVINDEESAIVVLDIKDVIEWGREDLEDLS